jgi:excisionase family DNA binding protein
MPAPVVSRVAIPDYVTVAETATLLGRDRETIYRWVRAGRLTAVRDPGGGVLIPIAALRALPRVGHEEE